MDHDLTVRYTHPNNLTLHPDNARKGNLDALKRSLKKNGQYKPVVVSKRTGFIVAGNHTTMALRELGVDRVAFVSLDLDEVTEKRILAADNRIGDLGTYDNDLLLSLLEGLDDLDGTGYTDVDLDVLRLDDDTEDDEDYDDEPSTKDDSYGAIISCNNMQEQHDLMVALRAAGFEARPLKKE